MKKIHTRLFRIEGIWQIGFPGLRNEDVRELRELHHFRYNSQVSLWHIPFHINTLHFLNNKFDGKYEFTGSSEKPDNAPNVKVEKRINTARIAIDRRSDRFLLAHTYHVRLFKELNGLEGAIYDRSNRYWVLSIKHHYSSMIQLLEDFGFRVSEVDRTPEAMPESSSNPEVLPQEEELLKQFERELYIRNRSRRTIDSYLSAMRQFLANFSGRNLQDIANAEIRDYIHDLVSTKGHSYSTTNIFISAIKAFYQCVFMVDIRQITLPRSKRAKTLPKFISHEDIKLMIERTSNIKHRTIIITLYSTAIRREELLGLKLDDLDFENCQARIHGKGKKDRFIYLTDALIDHLRRYIKVARPRQFVFEGPGGKQYSGSSVGSIVDKAARRAGLSQRVTPHMLRHSYATHMLAEGVSPIHIQKILGHSSIKTTMIYTHITDNDLRRLPNPLDKLDL